MRRRTPWIVTPLGKGLRRALRAVAKKRARIRRLNQQEKRKTRPDRNLQGMSGMDEGETLAPNPSRRTTMRGKDL